MLPTLVAGLCTSRQRLLLWCAFSAMPLRLLERALPLLTGMLPPPEAEELLRSVKYGAARASPVLEELLCGWAQRGRGWAAKAPAQLGGIGVPYGLPDFGNETCTTHVFRGSSSGSNKRLKLQVGDSSHGVGTSGNAAPTEVEYSSHATSSPDIPSTSSTRHAHHPPPSSNQKQAPSPRLGSLNVSSPHLASSSGH